MAVVAEIALELPIAIPAGLVPVVEPGQVGLALAKSARVAEILEEPARAPVVTEEVTATGQRALGRVVRRKARDVGRWHARKLLPLRGIVAIGVDEDLGSGNIRMDPLKHCG